MSKQEKSLFMTFLMTPDMANFKVLMPDLTYISANRDKIRSEFERIYGVAEESK